MTTDILIRLELQKCGAAYIIFVADAADIVCGVKDFMWNNFGSN